MSAAFTTHPMNGKAAIGLLERILPNDSLVAIYTFIPVKMSPHISEGRSSRIGYIGGVQRTEESFFDFKRQSFIEVFAPGAMAGVTRKSTCGRSQILTPPSSRQP